MLTVSLIGEYFFCPSDLPSFVQSLSTNHCLFSLSPFHSPHPAVEQRYGSSSEPMIYTALSSAPLSPPSMKTSQTAAGDGCIARIWRRSLDLTMTARFIPGVRDVSTLIGHAVCDRRVRL